MPLPLLTYQPTSQNHRVSSFEVGGDQQPRLYSTHNSLSLGEMDDLIMSAYRQIFNEQQMTETSRQWSLESQLRGGQITTRDFIAGLAGSEVFRTRNYDTNNNYRFVQMCVQRILGRDVYSDREKFAWSTLIATKGLKTFINELVNTDEYIANFGDTIVPYQRRRELPTVGSGTVTFNHMARYDEFYRANLPEASATLGNTTYRWAWQRNPPPALRQAGAAIVWGGVAGIGFLLLAIAFKF
jgi:phycobilisome rod-core linker protein